MWEHVPNALSLAVLVLALSALTTLVYRTTSTTLQLPLTLSEELLTLMRQMPTVANDAEQLIVLCEHALQLPKLAPHPDECFMELWTQIVRDRLEDRLPTTRAQRNVLVSLYKRLDERVAAYMYAQLAQQVKTRVIAHLPGAVQRIESQ